MNAVMPFVSTSLRRSPSVAADSGVNSEYLVRIAGLEKIYQAKDGNHIHALQDINLDIRPAEFISIVGPRGGGKTTLLKILAGLLKRTAWDLGLLGRRPRGPTRQLGVGSPSPVKFSGRSVW